ncbi:MAG: pyruvate ferredoxin oxidoreductase [Proteobacteria bacterium]|nr:pyruvate ferredoxin oxidoreductase [Pseudomonadota bacterium]
MTTQEVRLGGFGGQGVILAGMILGRAKSIFEDKYATLTQDFGPEARGGAASCAVILSDDPILYPNVYNPDVLLAMSQEAFTKYIGGLKPGGILVVEEDLVILGDDIDPSVKVFSCPATRFAEEIGRKIVLNIVMYGFLVAVTGLISEEIARKGVEASIPKGTEKLNFAAFEKGYQHGIEQKKQKG